MMLAAATVRKTRKVSDKVVRFPKILECENIEIDSLEGDSSGDDRNVSKTIINCYRSSTIVNKYFFKSKNNN